MSDADANNFPQLFRLRQTFQGPAVDDLAGEVHRQLGSLNLEEKITPGQTVAITVGSRGIANIPAITKAIVDFVRELKAEPFIVPAMGSHGGATAEGQIEVLKSLGVTEATCGCPIRSSMDTVVVTKAAEGFEVHFDREAFEADHVIVCGRIKLHTDFRGEIQSGLMKMMLIGLGKQRGASIYHKAFQDHSFDQIVRSVSADVVKHCRIAAGLAIVENGYEQTAVIEAVEPEKIETREPELLKLADQWMARLPFDDIDLLIVDEIGKNISGTGMDTNVVGRKRNENSATDIEKPRIKKILVRSLTEATHGNATGIGVADFTTQNVVDEMDYVKTSVNCVTSGRTAVGNIPICFATDEQTIRAALDTIGLVSGPDARVVRIKNTLHLEEMLCSRALLQEAEQRDGVEVVGELTEMKFNDKGALVDAG